MTDHDDQLDAHLRDVPVPGDLAGRVMARALFDDVAIDRVLARVDPPAGLTERVLQATAAMRAVAAMPLAGPPQVPAGSSAAGSRRGVLDVRRMRFWSVARELLADGAAVAAALSLVGLMFYAGTELSRRMAEPATARGTVRDRMAIRGPGSRLAAPVPETNTASDRVAGLRSRTDEAGGMQASAPPATSVAGGNVATFDASTGDAAADGLPASVPGSRATAVEVRAAPAAEPPTLGDRGIGNGEIRTVSLPRVGRRVPRTSGYDIAFEMAHGESPFVDPSAAAALAVDRPPFSLRTDSFDSLRGTVLRDRGRAAGRRSRRGAIPPVRTEEILAAIPLPTGSSSRSEGGTTSELRLAIDAVRSSRPAPGSLFVEVCVSSLPMPVDPASGPLDVMLLLDQTAGPFGLPSWQWLCRAISRLIDQMGSADRLSLIVCGERPRLAALRADSAAIASLLPELMAEPAARSADIDAAFRLASAVARREGRPDRVVAVTHAATVEHCHGEGRDAFSAWQADLAAGGPPSASTSFVLIDPQESSVAGGRSPPAAPADMGRVDADSVAISRALSGRVFGRSTLVASDCRLEVAFDPGMVRSYRIVGYRQTAAESLSGGDALPGGEAWGGELHAGETVRVVYELVRRQAARTRAAPVSVTLAWSPVAGASVGTPAAAASQDRPAQRMVRQLPADAIPETTDPGATLPTPHGCELLMAVALGELDAGSIHADPWRHPTAGIAGLASRWQARGDVTPIGEQLIECLRHQGLIPSASGR